MVSLRELDNFGISVSYPLLRKYLLMLAIVPESFGTSDNKLF